MRSLAALLLSVSAMGLRLCPTVHGPTLTARAAVTMADPNDGKKVYVPKDAKGRVPKIPKGPFGGYAEPGDSQSVGIVGDRSRSKQIAKFEAASDYLFFQGPAPKTAIQEDLPDFFSAVRTALNCAAVLRIEPTLTRARRPTRHRKISSLRSRT